MARVKEIMQLRRFAESWHEVESGVSQEDLTKNGLLEKVLEIQVKRIRGEI